EPRAARVLRRRCRGGQRRTRGRPAAHLATAAEPPDPRARGRAGGPFVRAVAARRTAAAGGRDTAAARPRDPDRPRDGGVRGALALAFAAAPARADDQAGMPNPSASRSKTIHDTVTITAIDKSARLLTVKNEAGEMRNVQVPSDVQAFDKLKKGDKIDIDYT